MRVSQYLLATEKNTPADAVVKSHQLMLRAGMIRRLASGLYTWLPTGLRVLQKVEHIVREEMNRAGAQEMLMPVVQPLSLWEESGRAVDYGPELLRFKDRHNNDFCLGPTHEEVITDIARNALSSYKQLPMNFYQINTKFRDEIRPRFGMMRSREFIMKDAYSFHLTQESLQDTYDAMYQAYCRIFDRIGLDYRAVEADTGSIGGSASHEFHVLADSGEDTIAFSDGSDYAANVELAEAVALGKREAGKETLSEVATPGVATIEELVNFLELPVERTVKTLIVHAAEEAGGGLVALLLRGDHELNEIKAEKLPQVASPLVFASDEEIIDAIGAAPGSLGPVGLSIPMIADRTVAEMFDFVAGANKDGYHLTGINWERDVALSEVADIRTVVEGDPSPDGKGNITLRKGIEVGHIFQLGDTYSSALNATVLDENGKQQIMTMGCYGIGVTRIVAAVIEQCHDDKGIIWPQAIAPYDVALIPVNIRRSPREKEFCDALYESLTAQGLSVLYDDRDRERLGVKLADCELIGIPHRLVISEKGLDEGRVEYRARTAEENEHWPEGEIAERLQQAFKA